ncbi:BQ5605_C035g11388 [Microbotryum silenes-dioicae]|uniref:BQ5605_C035g11388 protein n=1 Tax=Microbotryum silenes-dioicae TaxID=796604 RepID=A0A2X0N2C1_9BASI|nr:BQ5605_C035g11388 [Microbotryum silenes-dioicae]
MTKHASYPLPASSLRYDLVSLLQRMIRLPRAPRASKLSSLRWPTGERMFTFCIQRVSTPPSHLLLTPRLTATPFPVPNRRSRRRLWTFRNRLNDTIRVEPRDFGKDPVVAIREEIQRRYANKVRSQFQQSGDLLSRSIKMGRLRKLAIVLPEVGLVISLLDILEATEGAVLYGDGCYYYRTEFRLIVFRPFVGEAFLARVSSQSEEGIKVTVGFFDDILIPPHFLPLDSAFDPSRRAYFFVPAPEDENGQPAPNRIVPTSEDLRSMPSDDKLYIERKDWLRIRCEQELWHDVSPTNGKSSASAPPTNTGVGVGPGSGQGGAGAGGADPNVSGTQAVERGRSPYSLICSIREQGLGVLEWWDQDDDEEEGEDQAMA